jgi:hypothetical protein
MIKKTVTFKDFDGNERTEDFYFHMTEQELTEWEFSVDGGLSGVLTRIINSTDLTKYVEIFKDLLIKSYGVKTPDGRGFIKNKEVLDNFIYTQAFSDIYMELATDDKAAAEFVNGIIPASLKEKAKAEMKVAE